MRESARKVVLVHLGRWSAARQRFAGICRYARQHGWTLHLVEDIAHDISYPWKDAIDYWRPDGVIIDGDDVYVPPRMKGLAVHCDADPRKMHGPYYGVVYDSIGATEKAIGELKSLAYGHYAFAGYYVRVGWAEVRRNRFLKEFAGFRSPTFVLEDGNGQVVDHLRRMRVWLQSLPKPCGIFAANDRIGRDLANFCLQLGYAVPGDVAIVGIDNDETLCDGSEPTLTSATQNFDESGHRAAEMLDSLMRGLEVSPPVKCLSEAILIRRQSTRRFNAGTARLKSAVGFIRQHACEGIGAREVVQYLNCTRRKAERDFRAFTGHSIMAEILDVRYARACELLKNPGRSLESIYLDCGYRDNTAFRRFFFSRTGLPPGEWRKLHT